MSPFDPASIVVHMSPPSKQRSIRVSKVTLAAMFIVGMLSASGCGKSMSGPLHRERSNLRDADCRDPKLPHAFFYPAANRTEYGPDDPKADHCELLVPDHLFCCPDAARTTDR